MLSKKEIEKAKEDFKFFNEGDYITKEMSDSKNVLLEYIDQLESDKQKLIEKLEEVIKETSQNINSEVMKKYQNLKMEEINDETYILLAMHRIGFAGEILEIVKG